MLHVTYGDDVSTASIAILVKERGFNGADIKREYITSLGANPAAFVACSLWYDKNDKCPAMLAKDYLQSLLLELQKLKITTLIVTDAKYFKYITGEQRAAVNYIGYANDSQIENFKNEFTVFYVPNYQAAVYNHKTKKDLAVGIRSITQYLKGNYIPPGKHIIHSAKYPVSLTDINTELNSLHKKPKLTVDIETLGLNFWECGISTISFAWDEHNFISIAVDRGDIPKQVKQALKRFFEKYRGTLIAHNANFDFKVLTYELWMDNLQDYVGMHKGIELLTHSFEDTKLISYLAINNTVENVLNLKALAAEYLGDYAEEDIKDTSKIPLPELLEYNGKDCLGTWFVYNKYHPLMVKDKQKKVYTELFKPSVITLLHTELFGLPIFPDKVALVKQELGALNIKYSSAIQGSILIKEFHLEQQEQKRKEFTEIAKKKVFTMDDPRVQDYVFNPNSNLQVSKFLYEYLGFPVLDVTDGGQPSVGGKTLKKLLNHSTKPAHTELISSFIGLSQVDKILSSFIPAFEKAVQLPDGSYRLFGNFNLGGTVSGRLSSSKPNLQNIPSHSKWGKLIKQCFGTIKGWMFGGADFNSLEDMVSALTTRDKNKMLVYIDGFDGHCLRASFYFKDDMPNITKDKLSINSIKNIYPEYRQKSKEPTFLLTYGGTYHGLMNSLGLNEVDAKRIETQYHELYFESDEWVADKLQTACANGYITGAFGLRLRTPLLHLNGKGKLNYKAASEGRTAGNMLGQSYGMLNSRAANEFRERIGKSEYKYDVFICGQIHDAIYVVWKNKLDIAKWVNDNIIASMQWCELKELQHPIVKLGAELDIFYPDWTSAFTIPNGATMYDIHKKCHP